MSDSRKTTPIEEEAPMTVAEKEELQHQLDKKIKESISLKVPVELLDCDVDLETISSILRQAEESEREQKEKREKEILEHEVGEKLEELAKEQLEEENQQQPPMQSNELKEQPQAEHHEEEEEQKKEEEREQEQVTQSYAMTAQVTPQGGKQDSNVPRWLGFNFERKRKIVLSKVTLQDVMVETPKKRKRENNLHHLIRNESGEVLASIATPMPGNEGEEPTPTSYQVSQVNLGKKIKWGEIATLDATTASIKRKIEKEHKSLSDKSRLN
ncbi:uncharacterized protein LOC131859285 [Cryptomeria japonica]|uniref:uncharacterized protein LOC131859285 n=1 Tax=Cryptomeria japonica TaxID=3369 RepID=UPI0027D9FF51|nr:uncharacterized protein LOC131859285 [Cryptomeria japonica]